MIRFITENSTCIQLFKAINWDKHPLGNREAWPASLHTTLSILFNSRFPMFLYWGPDFYCFYNDAFRPSLGKEGKHPSAMGAEGKKVWTEIWDILHPQIMQVYQGGPSTWFEDALIPIYRNGKLEDVYWTYSHSPVIGEDGEIAGIFVACTETTGKVLAEKRMQELTAELEIHTHELTESYKTLAIQNTLLQNAEAIAHLGSYEWELLTGKIVWSEQLYHILGLRQGEVTPSFDFAMKHVIQKEEQEEVMAKIEYCKINRVAYKDNVNIVRPDGSIRHLEIEGRFEYDNKGEPLKMVGIVLDITERRKIESEKLELASIIENSLNEVYIFDCDSLRFTFLNKGALKNIGYNLTEMQELTPLDIKPEYTAETFRYIIEPLLTNKKSIQVFSTVHQRKDGSLYPVEVHLQKMTFQSKPVFVAIIIDITEQNKEAEAKAAALKQLEISEAKYRLLFESSPLPKIIYNLDTLQVLDVNQAAVSQYGYSKSEFIQLNLKALRPSKDIPHFLQNIEKIKDPSNVDRTFGPLIHIKKNGEEFYAEINIHRSVFNNQNAIIAVVQDVSAKLDAEKIQNEFNQALLNSNRELQEFASTTAHDLQQPLRMVSSFTSLLDRKYGEKLDEKAREYIYFAVDGARRMQTLIKDILEYAQAGSNDISKEQVEIDELLQQVLSDLTETIQKKQAILNIPKVNVSITGNKTWLYRLFINLFSNALKFTAPERKPEIMLTITEQTNHYKFTITDNGIGIEPDDLPRLFKTYSRLQNNQLYAGTGLGLSTCKKIVIHHGGSIHVQSQFGKGSSFIFTLNK